MCIPYFVVCDLVTTGSQEEVFGDVEGEWEFVRFACLQDTWFGVGRMRDGLDELEELVECFGAAVVSGHDT